MSYVPRCSFPYGHSVRPGQSSGSGDVQISTSCPRPHCLPIRRRVTTIVDFDPILLIPSQSRNIQQSIESVAETSTRKSIHPNYLHRRAYQPPSPDPHDRSRGGGFFCQRFFARLEMHTSDVTYARLSVICVMSTLMNTRLHALNRNALSLLSRAFPSLRSSLAPTSARSSNRGSSGIRPVRSDCDGLAVESFAQNHLGGHPRDGSGVFRDILQ